MWVLQRCLVALIALILAAGQEGRIRLPKACVIVETTADTCGKYHFGSYKLNTNETRRLSKECFGNRVAVFDFMVACAEPMAVSKAVAPSIKMAATREDAYYL
ncbi:hypothetical protein IscW_ISCW002968 [Ixodes scapularis]|uniref:Secreted salivary gland peptide n=1 Tax=Ixodes scapularis TaxID=6945 RepID=B7P8F5_IXOSC|nr:hypothetical protein IscW_ISCW002968 [Ixodes scapularis]|eukprot:XP_002401922.1 hypothetical protein IscW_ISCW002968 [Ixodes scapularis]